MNIKVLVLSISSMILGLVGLIIWYIYLFRHKINLSQVSPTRNLKSVVLMIMIWFILSQVTLMESFALKSSQNQSWVISCIVLQITYIQSITPFSLASSSSLSSKKVNITYLLISIIYLLIRYQSIISWDWFSCIFNILISIIVIFHSNNNNSNSQQQQQSIDQTKKMLSSTAKAQALNDLYYEILGLIPEGVAIFDKSKHMIFANKTIKDLFKSSKRTLEHILMSLSTDQQQNVYNNLGSQVNIPNNTSNPNSNTHKNNINQNNNNNNNNNTNINTTTNILENNNNNKSALSNNTCLNPENILPSPSGPSDRNEPPRQFQFFKSMQGHTYLQDNSGANTPNQLDITDHSCELQPDINSSRPLYARDSTNKLMQAISQSQSTALRGLEVDSPQFLYAEEGNIRQTQENYSNKRSVINDTKKVNQNTINSSIKSNATFAKPTDKEIPSPSNQQAQTIVTTIPNITNINNYTSPINDVNNTNNTQQCNFFTTAYQKTSNNTDTDAGLNTLTNNNTQGQFLNSNVFQSNPAFNSSSSLHFPFQTQQHQQQHHPSHTIMLNRLLDDNDGSSSLTKSPFQCSCNINSTNINSNNISSSSNINIHQNLIGTSINNYFCGHSGQFTERNLLDQQQQQQQQSYADVPAVAVGSPGGNTQQVTGYYKQHSQRKRYPLGNQDNEYLQGNQISSLISNNNNNNHTNNLNSPEHALQQPQQQSYRQSSIQKKHQKTASLRPESEEYRGSEIDMGCYFSKLGYFQDTSMQHGKSHSRLFKKRLLGDQKTTEIIQGEMKVSDILKDLFGERDKEMKLDVPGGNIQTQPAESNLGVGGNQQLKNALQRDEFTKQASFFKQMNNSKNALGYMQFQEDMMKVQVRWKDQIFVLKFLLFEIETAENHAEEFILVLVDPLWQEYYNKRMEEVEKYKMKMFASLSHELRTPLNCTISMLEGLEQFIQDPSIIEDYLYPALHSQKLLLNQINDILDFAQIDSGKFKYSFVDFDLIKLLEDCQTLMQLQANVKSLTLELLYDPRLTAKVKSDPNRIRQILLNFLSNSLKFTPEGGKITISAEPVYTFETENQQKYIRLSVKDTGMGMKPETLSNIFHAFNKTEYEKEGTNSQGCGLGLVISQSISRGLCCITSQNNIGSSNLVQTAPASEFQLPPASQGIQVESVYQHGSHFSFVIQDMDPKQLLIPGQSNMQNANRSNLQNYQQQSLNDNTLNDESFSKSSDSMSSNENSRPLDMIKEEPTSISTKPPRDIPDNEEHQQDQILKDSCNVQNESIPDGLTRQFQPQDTLEANFIEAQKLKEQENLVSQESPRCSQKRHMSIITKSQVNLGFPIHGVPSYSNHSTSPGQTTTQHGNHLTTNQDRESQLSIAVGGSNVQSQKGQQLSPKDRAEYQHVHDQSKERILAGGVTFSADPAEYDVNNALTHNAKSQLAPSQGLLFTQNSQPTPNSTQQQHLLNSELIAFRNSTFTSSKLTSNLSRTLTNKSLSKMISAQGFTGYHAKINITDDLTVKILSALQVYLEGSACCDLKCAPILIADDNQFNVLALSRVLQIFAQTPYDKAFDGNQAYQKIIDRYSPDKDDTKKCKTCRKYSLIFMDIEMPFMTGYEVIKKSVKFFKDNNIDQADLPYVIACTAHSADQEQIKAKIAGFDDYISKPIMKNDLQKLLCDWFYNQHYQHGHHHKHQSFSQNLPISGQGGLKSLGSNIGQLSFVALDK